MLAIVIGAPGTISKGLVKGLVDLEITRRDLPDYSIIKVDQNTEKSPGGLRRLTVTQTSMRNHQLTQFKTQ